jgi:hypothetical protein
MVLDPGQYGQLAGVWWVCPPRTGNDVSASAVPKNRVVEHEDGTITVQGILPSPRWKGRLERGHWIETPS